jgi:MinD-like ATPase involved in chromosome partitioning or flagellar assembly
MSREERTRDSKLLDRENMVIGEQQKESADESSRHLTANSEALMKLFGKESQQKEFNTDSYENSSGISDTKDHLSEQMEKEELNINSDLQNMHYNSTALGENHENPGYVLNVEDGKQHDAREVQQYQSYIPQQSVVPEHEQIPPGQQPYLVSHYQSEQSVSLYKNPNSEQLEQYRTPVNQQHIIEPPVVQYKNTQEHQPISNTDLYIQQRETIRPAQQTSSGQRSQVVSQYLPEQTVHFNQETKLERVEQYRTPVNQQQGLNESSAVQFKNPQEIQAKYNTDLHMQSKPIMQTTQEPLNQQRGAGRYAYRSIAKPEASYKSFEQQIIAVHSPKGGVGKTTISKELTFGLGAARVNNKLLKIVVVDGDWEFGDVATQFDVSPVPNVSEWVRDMRYDREQNGCIPIYSKEEINERYIIHYNENIDILAGSSNSNDAMLLDADIVSAILDNLRHCDYDFIIVDNANSLKDITIVPLQKADTIVLVETLDTTTVQETTTMLDTLRSIQFDFSKIRMVLNQVPTDDKKLDIGVAEIPRVLKLELTAVLPYYDKVRLYNNAGEAAILDRETPFSKELKKIINTILPIYNTKPKGLLARLLAWLFSRR